MASERPKGWERIDLFLGAPPRVVYDFPRKGGIAAKIAGCLDGTRWENLGRRLELWRTIGAPLFGLKEAELEALATAWANWEAPPTIDLNDALTHVLAWLHVIGEARANRLFLEACWWVHCNCDEQSEQARYMLAVHQERYGLQTLQLAALHDIDD